MQTLVAACLSEKARPKIEHCLEWSSESKLGGVTFGAESPLVRCHFWQYVTLWLGVPSPESLTHLHDGFGRGRGDQRLL